MNAKKTILGLSYLYIGLPIALFFIGWTKWWIAVPVCFLLIYSFMKAVNNETDFWFPQMNKETVQSILLAVALIMIWVYFSGIGGCVAQTSDHTWRNTIFNILVEYEWPVQKEMLMDGVMHNRVMIYYIAFWLPAAVVGKIFGLSAGYAFQMIWAVLGITLVYFFITSFLKKMSALPLVGLMIFSGLDYLGYLFTGINVSVMGYACHLETWNWYYQYSSFATQLNWVYNQAIYAWLLICLILAQKNSRQIILIWGCGLLSATLPFVGLIPFLLYKILDNAYQMHKSNKNIKCIIKDLFTIENVFCGGCVGILSFLYLVGNGTLNNTKVGLNVLDTVFFANDVTNYGTLGMNVGFLTATIADPAVLGRIFWYFLFILLEVGVYFLLVYRYQKDNVLFYITAITLCLIPMIEYGEYNDFCMRASIPALFVLFIMVMQTWYKALEQKDWLRVAALVIALSIGARTAFGQFAMATTNTHSKIKTEGGVRMEMVEEEQVFEAGNFSGEKDGNFFFEYIAR